MSIRAPYAAGLFYLGYETGLRREVEKLLSQSVSRPKLSGIGLVVPHAGYEYSGVTAGKAYASIDIPNRIIILGPNHSGFGLPISVDDNDFWKTPLGDVALDKEMADLLISGSKMIKISRDAHRLEHSIEVQLPFLQVAKTGPFIFTPISVMGGLPLEAYQEAADAIAKAIMEVNERVLIVASTDLTHYEPAAYAKEMDSKVIEAIREMNPVKMLTTVYENDITMCGYGPTAIMLLAATQLGAKKAVLIDYSTSADFSMDESSVVGYGSLLVGS
jgi:MEMO1 family protein